MVIIKDIQEAKRQFGAFKDFQECIIENLVFKDYLTTVVVSVANIWTDDGQLREDLDSRKELVHLEFKGVMSLNVFNDLTPSILYQPDRINWGFNEIALVEIKQDNDLYMTFSFVWESNRKIELTCEKLVILDTDHENSYLE